LLIERTRHEVLKQAGFPAKQKYLIKDDRLFELRKNYKGELLSDDLFYFEKQ
jgi:hypothetical protein